MKEIYEKPEIDIIVFDTEDVIVTSTQPNTTTPVDDGDDD